MSLLKMSLSGAVIIAVIALLRALLLYRLPKKTFLLLWGVALLRLLLPFSLPADFSAYSMLLGLLGQHAPAAAPASQLWLALPAEQAAAAPQAQPPAGASLHLPEVAWGIGAAICFLFFLTAYIRCIREFHTSTPVRAEAAQRWLELHPCRRRISIRQSDRICAPLTYGILRPVILMPKKTDWESEADGKLQLVLLHEYVHIRHFDTLFKLLAIAALCIHWFNPMVWLLYHLFSRDIELVCDETVLRQSNGDSRSDYAYALISMEEQKRSVMPLCNNFNQYTIQERITAIMKNKKTTLITAITAAVLVTGVTAVFATSAKATDSAAPNPDPASILSVAEQDTYTETLISYYENGQLFFSPDGGKSFSDEATFKKMYPAYDVEWWTYEEYARYVEQEKKNLQSFLDAGEPDLTQEMVDASIAEYEALLQQLKDGFMLSKSVNGHSDITIISDSSLAKSISESGSESGTAVSAAHDLCIMLDNGEKTVFGPYDSRQELLDEVQPFCEKQIALGNMTEKEAEEILQKCK